MTTMTDVAAKKPVNRTGTPLGIRVDDEIMEGLDEVRLLHQYPPTITAMVEDALRRYIAEEKARFADAKRPPRK